MAYFLFLDESGHDRKASPYEVLAGIDIRDADLWRIVTQLHAAELRWFGRRYSEGRAELKGTKLLKKKVFDHAALSVEIAGPEISALAREALESGASAGVRHLKALALAKLNYVREVFEVCERFGCRAFASIVDVNAAATQSGGLRKDYAYLFERFFYFLEDRQPEETGIVVFDELEKAKSHLLIDQTYAYFRDTATGRHRARLIVPEPSFVHSELTTGVQIADLVAYIVSWGFRIPGVLTKPARPELQDLAAQVSRLRYRAVRSRPAQADFQIWSFTYIDDLRTRQERQ